MRYFIKLFLFVYSVGGVAEELPTGSKYDYRVTSVNYNPEQVTLLHSHYGYSTHIQFHRNEVVDKIAVGDREAWEIAKYNNHIFLKPKDDDANTNMTVLTDKHTYNFVLVAQEAKNAKDKNMLFQITFKYPQEIEREAKEEQKKSEIISALTDVDPIVPTNWDYWIKGARSISPTEAYDDGRFTYLSFSSGADLPAIFMVSEDGSESLVNVHIKNNTVVIHKVLPKIIFRRGGIVACMTNKSYHHSGVDTFTGSTDPDIKRIIKGGGHE